MAICEYRQRFGGSISLWQATNSTASASERQASEELSQWKAPVTESKVTIDATPGAVALAMVMSTEELTALAAKLRAAREATPLGGLRG